MEVVEPALASEEVITVLGDAISDQVVIALDLGGRMETRLAALDAYLAETLIEALDGSKRCGRADLRTEWVFGTDWIPQSHTTMTPSSQVAWEPPFWPGGGSA